jgi:hypothetical protein
MSDTVRGRAAKNETFFAEANALMVRDAIERGDDRVDVICECAQAGCLDRIPITAHEYIDAHSTLRRFVVAVGHQFENVERVVRFEPDYVVVEKFALAS